MHVCDMTVTYLRGGLSSCSVVWVSVQYFFLKFIKFWCNCANISFKRFKTLQWTAEPTWREPLHAEVHVGRGKADGEDAAELGRAEQKKEKRQKEAAAEGLDMPGEGRDRKDMLQRWAQRLSGKA